MRWMKGGIERTDGRSEGLANAEGSRRGRLSRPMQLAAPRSFIYYSRRSTTCEDEPPPPTLASRNTRLRLVSATAQDGGTASVTVESSVSDETLQRAAAAAASDAAVRRTDSAPLSTRRTRVSGRFVAVQLPGRGSCFPDFRFPELCPTVPLLSGLCGVTVERSLLAIRKVAGSNLGRSALPGNSLGQAAHTHVPLCHQAV